MGLSGEQPPGVPSSGRRLAESRSLAGPSGSGVLGSGSATRAASPRPGPKASASRAGAAGDARGRRCIPSGHWLRSAPGARSRARSPLRPELRKVRPERWVQTGAPRPELVLRAPCPQLGVDERARLRRGQRLCPPRAAFGTPAPRPFLSSPLALSFSCLPVGVAPNRLGLATPGARAQPLWAAEA